MRLVKVADTGAPDHDSLARIGEILLRVMARIEDRKTADDADQPQVPSTDRSPSGR